MDKDQNSLLVLLNQVDEPLSMTKIQKLMFLIKNETDLKLDLEFVPYKYGPFSKRIYEIIDEFETDGFLKIEHSAFNDNSKFVILTRKGKDEASIIYAKMDNVERESINSVVKRWGKESLTSILFYTYLTYPESAEASVIKNNILH